MTLRAGRTKTATPWVSTTKKFGKRCYGHKVAVTYCVSHEVAKNTETRFIIAYGGYIAEHHSSHSILGKTRVMIDSKTDKKHIHLLKLIAQLRNHIDIHRIIGLNIRALQEGQISDALLWYLQHSAHESLAIYICKIFEASTRNDLNSIPGIIKSIPVAPMSAIQR